MERAEPAPVGPAEVQKVLVGADQGKGISHGAGVDGAALLPAGGKGTVGPAQPVQEGPDLAVAPTGPQAVEIARLPGLPEVEVPVLGTPEERSCSHLVQAQGKAELEELLPLCRLGGPQPHGHPAADALTLDVPAPEGPQPVDHFLPVHALALHGPGKDLSKGPGTQVLRKKANRLGRAQVLSDDPLPSPSGEGRILALLHAGTSLRAPSNIGRPRSTMYDNSF